MKEKIVKLTKPLLLGCMALSMWVTIDIASMILFGEYEYPKEQQIMQTIELIQWFLLFYHFELYPVSIIDLYVFAANIKLIFTTYSYYTI